MPMTLHDDDGNPVELPVDKVEDIKTLTEAAGQVAKLTKDLEEAKNGVHPDWPVTRARISKLETDLENARKEAEAARANGGNQPPKPLDENKAREIASSTASEALAKDKAESLAKKRDRLIAESVGSDANRQKVVMEKYKQLVGNKQVTDEDEMLSALNDALFLSNKNREGGSKGFDGGGAGFAGSGPRRGGAGAPDIERGAQLAQSMGYRPKTDISKLNNR